MTEYVDFFEERGRENQDWKDLVMFRMWTIHGSKWKYLM